MDPLPRRRSRPRSHRAARAALLIVPLLAGCAATPPAPAPSPPGFPVTVSNCGTPLTVTAPPTRAVSNDVNLTEDLLALGLAPRMVGTFGVRSDASSGKPVAPEYQRDFARVPEISPTEITLEPLVGLHPDFLFAGWNYGLHPGTALTPDNLARHGIPTLVLAESCAHVDPGKKPADVEDTYQDLRSLGAVFGVPERATALVERMKAEIAGVRARVGGLPTTTVFVYDSGEAAPFTSPGLAMPNGLITLGGGVNVFADLRRTWSTVSWEQVVAADPHCIIINNYGSTSAERKRTFLETSPITRGITAVRDRCFLTLDYDQLTPGPRNAGAVSAIARWLHPTAPDRPAR